MQLQEPAPQTLMVSVLQVSKRLTTLGGFAENSIKFQDSFPLTHADGLVRGSKFHGSLPLAFRYL